MRYHPPATRPCPSDRHRGVAAGGTSAPLLTWGELLDMESAAGEKMHSAVLAPSRLSMVSHPWQPDEFKVTTMLGERRASAHGAKRGHAWKFAALALSTSLAEQQSGWKACWWQRISVGQLTSGRSCGNDRAAGRGRQSDRVTWTCGIGAAAVQLWRLSSFWQSTATCRVRRVDGNALGNAFVIDVSVKHGWIGVHGQGSVDNTTIVPGTSMVMDKATKNLKYNS
ncbi:hypothetical protein ACQ4PT_053290 [Festuca glaucescens]